MKSSENERRSSADADNLRDAFGGQSRSPNNAVFTIFDFKICSDLEMGSKVTQGH